MKKVLSFCWITIFLLFVAEATVNSQTSQSDYKEWILPYQKSSLANRFPTNNRDNTNQIKLVVSVVSKTNQSVNNSSSFIGGGKSSYGAEIFLDGKVKYFSHDSMGSKGSCCSQLENAELSRIDKLLSNLPSDKNKLPPNGRRVVFQIPSKNGFDVRVYDLANAPNKILELLRLTKTQFRSSVLWVEPERNWIASDNHNDAQIALTSNGKQIISSSLNGPLKIWNIDSQTITREINAPQNLPIDGIILSPDNSLAIIDGWGAIEVLNALNWEKIKTIEEPFINRKRFQLSKPHFIKNGKFLVLESSEPSLHIYDTVSWQKTNLAEVPKGAISYFPALKNNRAIYSSKSGEVFLRDTKQGTNLKIIDKAKLANAVFSPDEKMVAVVTVNHEGDKWTRYRIRLLNAKNGSFIKELYPFEQDVCESVDGLLWSSDGNYLLVATKASIFFSSRAISIWNIKSGRHRAELSGCPSEIEGFGFLDKESKIIAGCGDGEIRIWNLADSLRKISEFEKQLED